MKPPGPERFDAMIEGTFIEVKRGLNAVRNLRASLLDLAYALQDYPDHRGLLVLADPTISEQRLSREWDLVGQTLRPELISRLGLVTLEQGKMRGYPKSPEKFTLQQLQELVRPETPPSGQRLPRPDYSSEILKILIHQWLLRSGPMTAGRLEEIAGCTYPTAAKVLARLSSYIQRDSNRSFALSAFPREPWGALLARGNELRRTVGFSDHSGQPRAAVAIARRIAKLGRKDIAAGGVIGARGHCPDLDLLGTPRVDLTLHCPGDWADLSFVSQLDPALAPATKTEPLALVVHVIRRRESFFKPGPAGLLWADPVECLLDLHEARLEAPAQQLFTFLAERRLNP
jgi:hypothetical protein